MKDVVASYEALIKLFERVQFFLQRLNRYTTIPLTPDMTLLLGKIMAQVLSVLALSTKEMKEMRFSGSIHSVFSSVADYETEKFVKRIAGRTDVEDALQQLDMLTKEESLMVATRNLEVTHRVDVNVIATQELTHRVEEVMHDVDGNVKETKELTRDVRDNVVTIDDNVKEAKHGPPILSTSSYIPLTRACRLWKQQSMNNNVRTILVVSSPIVILRHTHRESATGASSRMALPSKSLRQS